MATSPTKHAPSLPPPAPISTQHLSSPRSTRTLRKLQSATALSSNYSSSNVPSLITQQRQQQQRNTGILRDPVPHQFPPPTLQSHNRTRSNSDAVVAGASSSASVLKRNAMAKKIVTPDGSSKDEIESLVRQGPKGDVLGSLDNLRRLILLDGLEADSDGMSQLRIYIWLILLNTPPIATDTYLSLIHRGPSPAYSKIRNDTFRTLATDPLFKRRVSEASLIRLLNAIAWKLHDVKAERMSSESGRITTNSATEFGSPELQPARKHLQGASTATTTDGSEAGGAESGIYVQGMNVLCAPFLYAARSEAEAFVAFHLFITQECPGYVRGAMDGVHKGVALVDKCLAFVDLKLSDYLHSKGMHAEIYAFSSVLTLCACTPPLPEVLQLWDFLFAYGAHLNILCIVAQLLIMRETILASPSPTKILRSFPPLQAKKAISLAVSFVSKMPADLYGELVDHAK